MFGSGMKNDNEYNRTALFKYQYTHLYQFYANN